MPALLTDTHLCDSLAPADWADVLEDLQAFVTLEGELRAAAAASPGHPHPSPDDVASLRALHDRLTERSAALLEPAALADIAELDLRLWFARSVLFLTRLKQCVAADGVLDTAGSRSLAQYESDFYQSPENVQAMVRRLETHLGLSPEQVAVLAAEVERDLADAREKQALVRALRTEFGLEAAPPEPSHLRQNVHRLFLAMYPQADLTPDEVELVLTSTLIFFCLPLSDDRGELSTTRFAALSPEAQQPMRAFLAQVNRFTQDRFAHFPAFGFLDRSRLDPTLLARLAELAGLPAERVATILPQLITILPLAEIEKYLVHDVWGHGWQASMLRFDDLYAEIAEFGDPLDLSEQACSTHGDGLRLERCFAWQGSEVKLDRERFTQFAHGEVAERLPVALSAVLAELMADVVEYKFIEEHGARGLTLPNSSLLAVFPAKLDLTLQDVPFYFSQATKVFRQWSRRRPADVDGLSAGARRTAEQLIARGASPASATEAARQALAVWEELEQGHYAARLCWAAEGDAIRVNAFTRVALNFLGVHRAVLATYARLGQATPRGLPLKSFKDLLVLGASVFFEADPARNLWRVDEYLTLAFLPLCERLCDPSGPARDP